jgi:hypothetical protein
MAAKTLNNLNNFHCAMRKLTVVYLPETVTSIKMPLSS